MGAGLDYFEKTIALLENLRRTQMPAIEAAAEICAESIVQGGLVFLFGAGHSRMMCDEMTPRQGGFVGFFCDGRVGRVEPCVDHGDERVARSYPSGKV